METTLLFILLLLSCLAAQNITSAQDATTFALTYGYPLLPFQKVADRFLPFNATNVIIHSRTLDTPANTTVVKPNADTLYSSALIDLSETDLVLNVPTIPPSEFVLFSFFDTFGDNVVNLGSGNINGNGHYLVRGPQNGITQVGFHRDVSPGYVADVISPTTYGIFLIRWLVNSTNLDAVHGYQDMTFFTPGNQSQTTHAIPITSVDFSNVHKSFSQAESILELLAKYAPLNPPESPVIMPQVNRMLEAAGISNGKYTMPSGVDLQSAYRSANASAAVANTSPANNLEMNNGWRIVRPGAAGNFENGTEYAFRAAHAAEGFLGLQSPTGVYPTWRNASAQGSSKAHAGAASMSLGPDEAVVYTFSRKPPLKTAGFWSLTAYAGDYLIPNPLNRYSMATGAILHTPTARGYTIAMLLLPMVLSRSWLKLVIIHRLRTGRVIGCPPRLVEET